MIANLNPIAEFIDENMSTLQYASKAQYISNVPKINQDPRSKLIFNQKAQIERLQKELKMANQQINIFTATQNETDQNCSKCEELKSTIN